MGEAVKPRSRMQTPLVRGPIHPLVLVCFVAPSAFVVELLVMGNGFLAALGMALAVGVGAFVMGWLLSFQRW